MGRMAASRLEFGESAFSNRWNPSIACALFLLAAFMVASILNVSMTVSDAYAAEAVSGEPSEQTAAALKLDSQAELQSLSFSSKTKTIKAGKKFMFKVSASDISGEKVRWSVSRKKLASIDQKGVLSAKRAGSVVVRAKAGRYSARMVVTIKPKKIVAIDPGHSSRVSGGTEQVNPGSSIRKAKDNTGTAGRYTHVPEYKVALNVAKKMKEILEAKGYGVVLTRKDNKTAVSCKKRAMIANAAKADIFIRLHCDGASSSSVHGISMQSPGKSNKWTAKNHAKIARLSKLILRSTCKATGASSKGVYYRNDLTGNNWAKMPVTLIEMGFMSNPIEDRKLVKGSYQSKLAKGIVAGIDKYFGY